MSDSKVCLVTAWHNQDVRDAFCEAWRITGDEPHVVLQQDRGWKSCARTKMAGLEVAMKRGAEIIIWVDSDCHPLYCSEPYSSEGGRTMSLDRFMAAHVAALEPVEIEDFLQPMTTPNARGIPYLEESRSFKVPVAASLGFWQGMPDRDAARQLVEGVNAPMEFKRDIVYQQPTMLCGMNIAFRPRDWLPWCSLIDVSRMDDVFMSWLWSKEAARRGYCFNFQGPDVLHTRQSHVFNSLIDEAKHLEWNETGWRTIWENPSNDYATLRALLPV